MKATRLILAGFAVMLGFMADAGAHAFLDHAAPAVGSTVHGSPAEVRLWFTQEFEPAFSTVRVIDQNGRQVDTGNKQVDRGDRTLLRLSLPPLPAGAYRVVWRVLSADAHVTEGDFTFDVVP